MIQAIFIIFLQVLSLAILAALLYIVWEIYCILRPPAVQPAQSFFITQIIGGKDMSIQGTVPGATSTFNGIPNGALQAGNVPVWTVDDPNVTLTSLPNAAGVVDGLNVSAATLSTDTATSYNLTQSGINSAGAPISTSVNVPFLAPPPAPATGFEINQTS